MWLDVPVQDDLGFYELVTKRLPTSALEILRAHGLAEKEVSGFVIPRRTLTHRIEAGEPLTTDESDRFLRIARILALAETVFGERQKSLRWMRKPKIQLAGRRPIEILQTDIGSRLVEEMLYRIDDGIFA